MRFAWSATHQGRCPWTPLLVTCGIDFFVSFFALAASSPDLYSVALAKEEALAKGDSAPASRLIGDAPGASPLDPPPL